MGGEEPVEVPGRQTVAQAMGVVGNAADAEEDPTVLDPTVAIEQLGPDRADPSWRSCPTISSSQS